MQIDERQLVELITQEVLQRLQSNPVDFKAPEKRPLVVLTGRFMETLWWKNLEHYLLQVKEPYSLWLSDVERDSANLTEELQKNLCNGERELDLAEILSGTSNLILPWIPLAVLSKLVNLEPDTPATLLLTKALVAGQKVRVHKLFLEPQMDFYAAYNLTPITRRIQGLMQEAKALGFEWAKEQSFVHLFPKMSKTDRNLFKDTKNVTATNVSQQKSVSLLTATDVVQRKTEGEIVVPAGTIVTPLAKDDLKRYGLQLRIVDEQREVK